MRHGLFLGAAIGLLLIGLAACGDSLAGPEALEYRLELSDSLLVFGQQFDVDLVVTNPTSDDVILGSPMSCLALPSVYRGGERLDWDGTALGCLAAVGRHVVPRRGTLVVDFELRAALLGGPEPFDYEVEPEPGVYELRMESMAPDVPDLTSEVVVLD